MKDQLIRRIEELDNLNNNDLFLEIAISESSVKERLGLTDDDTKRLLTLGYRTFLEAKDRYREEICNSSSVKKFVENEKLQDRLQIITIIADFLMPTYNINTASSLALLIFKEGLLIFCSE